ncbi:hypothetical protein GON26_01360 [Flavobacterium sp. GA093]|uniref:Uncharacterized protein n=1 Tax=Flavobacterium hydrocarbonoxydans TaxID=2683249 RepID=A0A6I4NPM2_9FLAO|nr:hypothetical protein [Flavobacterium hydrocarbonoxydans]MWB92997.1 hypothetical protein [Flavobacterium hydrocarbonoxydans]
MWYKINFKVLAVQLLPTFLRKQNLAQLMQLCVTPISSLYDLWYDWRFKNIYKLEHNGQVCSLRGSLNDLFDPVERRIYIGEGQFYETTYIFTEAEGQEVWIETDSEDKTIFLRTESETADTGLDFIVYVPETIYNLSLDGLRAHINFYKAGGKRYNIFIDE